MKYSYKSLKRAKLRDALIIKKCEGKNVLHLGATDAPFTKEKLVQGMLLHSHIRDVASSVIGLDIDKSSIDFLSEKGINDIKYFDMNNLSDLKINIDIIIFGEIIEHLENLKIAFENLKQVMHPNTELVISTPNLFYIHNFFQIILRNHELVHHDHKVGFTYGTIKQLLESNGFEISEFYFTFLPRSKEKIYKKIIKFFCKYKPAFSENLLVVSKLI